MRQPSPLAPFELEAMHASNSIIMFADDTTVVGLITNNDETAYREEVRALGVWCQENNLSLKANKTKEMIVDFMKQQREQPPFPHLRDSGEGVRFLGVHITDKLKWSTHADSVLLRLFRRLNKFGMSPKTLKFSQMHNRKHPVRLYHQYGNCTPSTARLSRG